LAIWTAVVGMRFELSMSLFNFFART
jgi:hypothetical protein